MKCLAWLNRKQNCASSRDITSCCGAGRSDALLAFDQQDTGMGRLLHCLALLLPISSFPASNHRLVSAIAEIAVTFRALPQRITLCSICALQKLCIKARW